MQPTTHVHTHRCSIKLQEGPRKPAAERESPPPKAPPARTFATAAFICVLVAVGRHKKTRVLCSISFIAASEVKGLRMMFSLTPFFITLGRCTAFLSVFPPSLVRGL